jgi:2-phospho-L-lactate guanylyltransferase
VTNTWALLPVKRPEHSKTRLLSVLQPQECATLSRAMLMDVLTAIAASTTISHTAVLTNDDEVATLAEQLGHKVFRDQSDDELCTGLNLAAQEIASAGADTLLVLPGDIPTITPAAIDQLLEKHCGGLTLCPAIRDGGTNAVICSPPDAIPFQFGPNSAQRHLDAAEQAGLEALRLPLQAFFRDIDIPEDLIWLSTQSADSNTLRFLRQSGIFARLGPGQTGASA